MNSRICRTNVEYAMTHFGMRKSCRASPKLSMEEQVRLRQKHFRATCPRIRCRIVSPWSSSRSCVRKGKERNAFSNSICYLFGRIHIGVTPTRPTHETRKLLRILPTNSNDPLVAPLSFNDRLLKLHTWWRGDLKINVSGVNPRSNGSS